MKITIRLFGVFRIGRFKEEMRELPAGTRPRAVAAALQLPEQLLGIVLINDRHAHLDDPLHDGDSLALLPLLEGG